MGITRQKPDIISEPWIDDSNNGIRSVDESIHRVYWIALLVNLGLACFKITIGALGYSRLLVIDGLNSGAIAVVISLILFGIYMSHPRTVSSKYPNGKGKVQYIFTLVAGFFIAVGATIIMATALKSFFSPASFEHASIGICVSLISIMANVMLMSYLKQTESVYQKDAFKTIIKLQSLNIGSSIILVNSLLLSGLFGWLISEHIGSITISFIVLYLSYSIIKSSLDGVMDRSSGEEVESRLIKIVYSVKGIREVKFLHTRYSGHILLIDIQVCLDGTLTIKQTDKIILQLEKRMADDLKGISHVITIDRRPA